MIQDTSLEAYEKARQDLGRKQRQVLDALITLGMATNAELGDHLEWPVNRVTPRCLELRAAGLVLDCGRRPCKVTGSMAHCWQANQAVAVKPPEEVRSTHPPQQLSLDYWWREASREPQWTLKNSN